MGISVYVNERKTEMGTFKDAQRPVVVLGQTWSGVNVGEGVVKSFERTPAGQRLVKLESVGGVGCDLFMLVGEDGRPKIDGWTFVSAPTKVDHRPKVEVGSTWSFMEGGRPYRVTRFGTYKNDGRPCAYILGQDDRIESLFILTLDDRPEDAPWTFVSGPPVRYKVEIGQNYRLNNDLSSNGSIWHVQSLDGYNPATKQRLAHVRNVKDDDTGAIGMTDDGYVQNTAKWELVGHIGEAVKLPASRPGVFPIFEYDQIWEYEGCKKFGLTPGSRWTPVDINRWNVGERVGVNVRLRCLDAPHEERLLIVDNAKQRLPDGWKFVGMMPPIGVVATQVQLAPVPRCGQTWSDEYKDEGYHVVEGVIFDENPKDVFHIKLSTGKRIVNSREAFDAPKRKYVSGPTTPETDQEAFLRVIELEASTVPEGLTKAEWRAALLNETLVENRSLPGSEKRVAQYADTPAEVRIRAASLRNRIEFGWKCWREGHYTRTEVRCGVLDHPNRRTMLAPKDER